MTYRRMVSAFAAAGIDSPEWDAQLLIAHFCRVSREEILLNPDKNYASEELDAAARKRADRFPLQYLLGEWQFFRQTYKVSPACLIPRQDTERLVEEAIRLLPQNAFFVDLCTGSGCIAISILCERPDTTALAVDVSEEALQLAAENAKRNGVEDRMALKKADLLTSSAEEWATGCSRPAAILSNPPYIPTNRVAALSREVGAEPKMALDGGRDGIIFYRRFLETLPQWLPPDGFFLFEIGFDQREAICRLAAQHALSCKITKDYGGNDRVAELRKQN